MTNLEYGQINISERGKVTEIAPKELEIQVSKPYFFRSPFLSFSDSRLRGPRGWYLRLLSIAPRTACQHGILLISWCNLLLKLGLLPLMRL